MQKPGIPTEKTCPGRKRARTVRRPGLVRQSGCQTTLTVAERPGVL
jgi:hypothetical protein